MILPWNNKDVDNIKSKEASLFFFFLQNASVLKQRLGRDKNWFTFLYRQRYNCIRTFLSLRIIPVIIIRRAPRRTSQLASSDSFLSLSRPNARTHSQLVSHLYHYNIKCTNTKMISASRCMCTCVCMKKTIILIRIKINKRKIMLFIKQLWLE